MAIKYICSVCQAEFDYRCPDEELCPLSHPCTYCGNEVEVVKEEKKDEKEEVRQHQEDT